MWSGVMVARQAHNL